MKIVYLGSGEFGIDCLNALASGSTELAGVHSLQFIVTQPPRPAGRGRKPLPTPVARWANTNSVPFIETDDANTSAIIETVSEYEPDLIVVVAFGQKIGSELISLPPKGAINVHASLLPKYRGAAPINWAIINGETHTGISIITLAEKMDAGQIIAQEKTEIGPDETAGQLHDRLAQIAAPLLIKTIAQIADGTAVYTDQDHSKATLAPKLKKSDGLLDFSNSAAVVRRKILGLWPWPGASAAYLSKQTSKPIRVTIAMADVVQTSPQAHRAPGGGARGANLAGLSPGTLDENLNIICAKDALRIIKIKPAGSALMDFKDFANGRQTQPGDIFTKLDK